MTHGWFGPIAVKIAVHQIIKGDNSSEPLDAKQPSQPIKSRLVPQRPNGPLAADRNVHAERELSVEAPITLGIT